MDQAATELRDLGIRQATPNHRTNITNLTLTMHGNACRRAELAVDQAATELRDLGVVKRPPPLLADLSERHPNDMAPVDFRSLHPGVAAPPMRHIVCRVLVNNRCALLCSLRPAIPVTATACAASM